MLTFEISPELAERHGKRESRSTPRHHKTVFYDDDYYYDPVDYYDDDGYYYQSSFRGMRSKGKGKGGKAMSSMGMWGMGMGMMGAARSGYYGDDRTDYTDLYPKVGEIAFLDDQFFDDKFFEDDDCELVSFNETFAIPSASLFLAPDTSITEPGTPSLPGTLFIFERESVLDDGSPVNGTTVSGTCTRTESADGGAGVCNFIFVDDEGYTLNVNGLLMGYYGSELAVTGGTGGMVGVIGQMDLVPVFESDSDDNDIFLDALQYDVMSNVGLIVCPN